MSLPTIRDRVRSKLPIIAPSMLKCDFGNLQREIQLLEDAGAALLHLDVMDGHFVPNLSYGPMVIDRMRDLTQLPFDAHLMISQPARYLEAFLRAGCDAITIHIEAVTDPTATLRQIRAGGSLSGLALNPNTPVESIVPFIGECDLILVMSVEPGFGGQSFIPASLDKLSALRELVGLDVILSVDGGIGKSTIADASLAGAELFVAGSAVFDEPDYALALSSLRELCQIPVQPSDQGTSH